MVAYFLFICIFYVILLRRKLIFESNQERGRLKDDQVGRPVSPLCKVFTQSLEVDSSTNLAARVSRASPQFFGIRASWVRSSIYTSSSDRSTSLVWDTGLTLQDCWTGQGPPMTYRNLSGFFEVSFPFPANGYRDLCPAQPAGKLSESSLCRSWYCRVSGS